MVSSAACWPGGQQPVRSGAKPWGISEASDALYLKLQHDSRTAEISTWFTEQSLLCADSKVVHIYIFPQDFGGQAVSAPASLWSLQELRSLHGQYETLRGATFLCRISGADIRRPLGILTNLPGLQHSMSPGLSDLKKHGSFLHYVGPLPKTCGCSPPHPRTTGVSSNDLFRTQIHELLKELFWKFCFSCLRSPLVFNPVTDGDIADNVAHFGSPTFSVTDFLTHIPY